jgi:hypothetical protein
MQLQKPHICILIIMILSSIFLYFKFVISKEIPNNSPQLLGENYHFAVKDFFAIIFILMPSIAKFLIFI